MGKDFITAAVQTQWGGKTGLLSPTAERAQTVFSKTS